MNSREDYFEGRGEESHSKTWRMGKRGQILCLPFECATNCGLVDWTGNDACDVARQSGLTRRREVGDRSFSSGFLDIAPGNRTFRAVDFDQIQDSVAVGLTWTLNPSKGNR